MSTSASLLVMPPKMMMFRPWYPRVAAIALTYCCHTFWVSFLFSVSAWCTGWRWSWLPTWAKQRTWSSKGPY